MAILIHAKILMSFSSPQKVQVIEESQVLEDEENPRNPQQFVVKLDSGKHKLRLTLNELQMFMVEDVTNVLSCRCFDYCLDR